MTFPRFRADGTYARGAAAGPDALAETPPARHRGPLLIAGGALWLLLLLALLTHHAADAGFSTSGLGGPVHNRAGTLVGRRPCVLHVRLLGLVVDARGGSRMADCAGQAPARRPGRKHVTTLGTRRVLVGGVVLPICSSCALESTRLYGWDTCPDTPAVCSLGAVSVKEVLN